MKPFRVSGTSMWPVLKTGDLVFTQSKARLEPGDLVVRTIEGTPTVHRYLGAGITKGDCAPKFDDSSGFSENGAVVIGIVPRKLHLRGGELRIAPANSSLNVLTRFQTTLSRLQAQSASRLARISCRVGLLGNGLVIRGLYYSRKQESLNVVHE